VDTFWQVTLFTLAGFGGGLVGSVAGLASLVSYPALIALGVPPITANATNTVALVFGGIGSTLGSRPELVRQGPRLKRLGGAAVLGGLTGGLLLLITPASAFEKIVPFLIGSASILILLPRPKAMAHRAADGSTLMVATFAINIYGGFFGAAAGVLMLATLLTFTGDSLPRSNALKGALMAMSNSIAAVTFVIAGTVDWLALPPLAFGCLLGGRLGPVVVRRAPVPALKWVIAVGGMGLAVSLAVKAY
jgi:uncharacterized membrane protein YfcA